MTKSVYRPDLEAEKTIKAFIRNLITVLPRKLGTPELIPGCEVIALDPFATGVLPRQITVTINEYHQFVTYRGTPTLAVGDLVLVAHFREADLYEVVGVSGSGGSITPADLLLGVWVFDVSLALLTQFVTINGALAYGPLAAGDYVLIGPGTYDEAITLVNGVIITEMVPGSVIINLTTANVAVTTVGGGYLQVKEIRVTRANNNIRAVNATHGAGDCTIIAELIRAQNAGTGSTIGVNQTGAGNLFVFANDAQASGGDSEVLGAACDAGVQIIYANCLAENGAAFYSVGAECDGGTQTIYGDCTAIDDDAVYGAVCAGSGTQVIRGHCTATSAAGGSDAFAANCVNVGSTQTVYGQCTAQADNEVYGAEAFQSTQTIYGHCFATAIAGGGSSFGARSRADAVQIVWGNCTATGGGTSIGAYLQTWAGTPTQSVNGDVTGDFYGAQCETGTQTITNGRATGATADLRRTGGTMQIFSVQHDTVAGTITWLDGTSLQSLRQYAQGLIMYGGAADWTVLAHPAAANRVLQSTATEIAWSANAVTFPAAGAVPVGTGAATQVAYWTGVNVLAGDPGMTYNAGTDTLTLAGGLTLTGGAAAVITVNDNVANAMTLIDAGGLEYLRVISTNAQPSVVFNENQDDIDFRVEGNTTTHLIYADAGIDAVGIGTTPFAGLRLNIGGKTRVGGNLVVTGWILGAVNNVSSFQLTDTAGAGRIVLFLDANDDVWIGPTGSPAGTDTVLRFNAGNGTAMVVLESGFGGIGTVAPDRRWHMETNNADTNVTDFVQRLSHVTSGAAAANFGTGTEHELEDAGGNNRIAATFETYWTNPAAANFSAAYEINVVSNTAMLDMVRMDGLNTQPAVVWNEGGADIDHRWEAVGVDPALFIQGSDGYVGIGIIPTAHLDVQDVTVDTTAAYVGLRANHIKTAGVTDHNDFMIGLQGIMDIDQVGGVVGDTYGCTSISRLSNGTIGAAPASLRSMYGFRARADLNRGTITGNAYGVYAEIDQEAANTIAGDANVLHLIGDFDGTVTGTSHMLYLDERDGVDYGIYQNGTAPSSLGGDFYWHGDGSGLLFGSMYAAAEIIVPIAAANPVEVENAAQDGWTAGELNGVTFPGGGTEHYLTITVAGRYEIIWNMSFHIATGAGSAIHGGVMIDGVAVRDNGEAHRDVANINDTGNMGAPCIADLPNGTEEISLWIINDNSNDVHVMHTTVTVKQIGGT